MKLFMPAGPGSGRSRFSEAIIPLLTASLFQVLAATEVANPFDALESTISTLHSALSQNSTSCRSVISSFTARIQQFNPTINAMTSLNPDALSVAEDLDRQLVAGNMTGKLFCVPVVLKDNYDAAGMNTTGSNAALAGNRPKVDGPLVKALRNEGAVILGKTNLHDLALEGLTVSSFGGQTVNPYDHTRTPGGSSGGTGAALATSFAILGTGTDTVNSLRSPASANSLVSVRPTRGLLTRTGVVPISTTQDNVGPMARTIEDLAIALTVMASAGVDEADNSTLAVPPEVRGEDYSAAMTSQQNLEGLRIGVVEGFWNRTESNETTPVADAVNSMIEFLKCERAEIVAINETIYNATALAELDVQVFEFRDTLNAYLSSQNLEGDRPTDFDGVWQSGEFLVIPSQYKFVDKALQSSTADAAYATALDGINKLIASLNSTFTTNNLDALVYPEQKNLVVEIGSASQAGRNGILAALTGYPVVTVPAGFSPATADAPIGVPIGMEIMGLPFSEGKLLNLASHITQHHPVRRVPQFADETVPVGALDSMPSMTPDKSNIPSAYPMGRLS
ncbi:amidase signature domain-containing protein [Biscogniauxia marginata]|nr:amidase signature domain-containing protein [Biscogniauxia marginata]